MKKYCFNQSCPNSIQHIGIQKIEFNEYIKNKTTLNEPILIYLCDDCKIQELQVFCGFCDMEMYDNWIEVDFTPFCRNCLPLSEFGVSLIESLKRRDDLPRSIEFYSGREKIRRIKIRSIDSELDYYFDENIDTKDDELNHILECDDVEYLRRIFH